MHSFSLKQFCSFRELLNNWLRNSFVLITGIAYFRVLLLVDRFRSIKPLNHYNRNSPLATNAIKMRFPNRDLKVTLFGAVTSWWSDNPREEYVVHLDGPRRKIMWFARSCLCAEAAGGWQANLLVERLFLAITFFFFFNFEIIVYRYAMNRGDAERSQVAASPSGHALWNRITYRNQVIDTDTVQIRNMIITTRRVSPVLLHGDTCFPLLPRLPPSPLVTTKSALRLWTAQPFSRMAAPFSITTSWMRMTQLLPLLPGPLVLLLFLLPLLWEMWSRSALWFSCAFPRWLMMLITFSRVYLLSVHPFRWNICSCLVLIF